MKVNLKRNWYGPGDVRFRKSDNPHDFSKRLLAQTPKDALVQGEDGSWITAGEWRKKNDVQVALPVPKPYIEDASKRPVLGSGHVPVQEENPGRALDLGRANERAAEEANDKAAAFQRELLEEQSGKKDLVEAEEVAEPRRRSKK